MAWLRPLRVIKWLFIKSPFNPLVFLFISDYFIFCRWLSLFRPTVPPELHPLITPRPLLTASPRDHQVIPYKECTCNLLRPLLVIVVLFFVLRFLRNFSLLWYIEWYCIFLRSSSRAPWASCSAGSSSLWSPSSSRNPRTPSSSRSVTSSRTSDASSQGDAPRTPSRGNAPRTSSRGNAPSLR